MSAPHSRWPWLTLCLLGAFPEVMATSPQPPFEGWVEVEGDARTGTPVLLIFHLHANSDLDQTFHLWVPSWVEGERKPWVVRIEAGGDVEHSWRVTPTLEGFWTVGLTGGPDSETAGMACCGMVIFSTRSEGRTEADIEGLLPPADVETSSHVEIEGTTAVAAYTIHPRSDWMRFGNVTVSWSSFGDPGGNVEVPLGEATVIRRPIDVPESGNGVVTFMASWAAHVEAPAILARPAGLSLDCRNVSAIREGATLRDDGFWTCFAEASPSRPWGIPAPVAVPVALLVLGLAATRRPRGP